jgi:hypothetical protein
MRSHTRPARAGHRPAARMTLSAVVVVGLIACGGDSVPTGESTPTTTLAPRTTTTVAPTTTTTTPRPPRPVFPLTGVRLTKDDGLRALLPALVVKIDNAPAARPQTGFNSADLVYEEIVNDSLTRFALVFHSAGSDPVGPIRSGRLQDIDLFGSLSRPLFAWSGGNATVTAAIRGSDLREIGPSTAYAAYFRSAERRAPSNLYATTGALWGYTPPDATPPRQQFEYREKGDRVQGEPAVGAAVTLDSIDVRWDWDPSIGQYRRIMEGSPHLDRATNSQITTDNVVVLVMNYAVGISGSPDAQSVGTGEAFVFSAGKWVSGSWTRKDRTKPFRLRDNKGRTIRLSPGRTFIELPRPGYTLPLLP